MNLGFWLILKERRNYNSVNRGDKELKLSLLYRGVIFYFFITKFFLHPTPYLRILLIQNNNPKRKNIVNFKEQPQT